MQRNLWKRTTVGEVFRVVGGGTPSTKAQEFWNGSIPWITSADIDAFHRVEPRRWITKEAIENSAANVVPAGSIIVVTRVGLGKVAVAPTDLAFSQDSQALLPAGEKIDPNFTVLQLSQRVQNFKHISRGTTINGVTKKQLLDVVLLLPPLEEQQRIVGEIEKQFTRLDAGVSSLKRVQTALKRYRASVLKAACEGRLVPSEVELACKEDRSYEIGEQLLRRILKERRENWNGKGKYKEPPSAKIVDLPQLPKGWAWATVQQLNPADRPCAYGVLQPGPNVPDGIPIVRVGNINDGKVDQVNLKLISPKIAAQYPRTKLRGGEVAISLVGAIGRTAVIPQSLAGANTARAVGIMPMTKLVNSNWVEIWFRNPRKIAEMTSKSHEVARKTLNLEDVRTAVVALPPTIEQRRIVAEVERRLSVIEELEAITFTELQRATRLRQSILQEAFARN